MFMRKIILTFLTIGAVLLFGPEARAQQSAPAAPPAPPPGYGAAISLEQTKAAIAAAEAEMTKNGWNMVLAVVAPSGETLYLQKSDLAANGSLAVAQEKARTSALFRAPSKVFQDRLATGETYLLRLPGALPVAGGVPIVVGGKVIGAIGASGASSLQDHQVAAAGAAAVK
jgi:glc operon protein GlcG